MRNEMTDWHGHEKSTSTAMLELLTAAHTGRTRFSRSERALFTACEFWAASRNRSLSELLRDDPVAQLKAAEGSFNVIDLKATACAVGRARLRLGTTFSATSLKRVTADLENILSAIEEPVDERIAEFARKEVSIPGAG